MNKPFLLLMLICFAFAKAYSQQPISTDSLATEVKAVVNKKQSPEEAVKEFFKHFHARDTAAIKEMSLPNLSLQTILISERNGRKTGSSSYDMFLTNLAAIPDSVSIEERLIQIKTINSQDIATVSTSYEFYLNGEFTHNGTNIFTLVFIDDKWKVAALADSRYYP